MRSTAAIGTGARLSLLTEQPAVQLAVIVSALVALAVPVAGPVLWLGAATVTVLAAIRQPRPEADNPDGGDADGGGGGLGLPLGPFPTPLAGPRSD
ncbi:hypothetical protein [Pseudonocardia parietis]|uniref:Uncharacterized protein n=1 Tax=Pseudonocardia parietis TaxID=570936 RepID=A0ABS4W7B1_9PSEU|nr:hypothetical protein [Pseudonocardia parietis]MBP2372055.1 hypothetical protein [Pseudonocardia parietis]